MNGSKDDEEKHHSCGVWMMCAKINHSCLSNARRSFIGDLQIVRATSDIPANTEVTFWYSHPTGDYNEMKKKLEHWGFQCDCAICLDLKNTPKKLSQKRKDLFGDLKATLSAAIVDTAKAERLLDAAGQTYKRPPTEIARLALQDSYAYLISIYRKQGNGIKVAAMIHKRLEAFGFVLKGSQLQAPSDAAFRIERWGIMDDDVARMLVELGNTYFAYAPHLVLQSVHFSRLAYRICVGEDETFEESYDPTGLELGN